MSGRSCLAAGFSQSTSNRHPAVCMLSSVTPLCGFRSLPNSMALHFALSPSMETTVCSLSKFTASAGTTTSKCVG